MIRLFLNIRVMINDRYSLFLLCSRDFSMRLRSHLQSEFCPPSLTEGQQSLNSWVVGTNTSSWKLYRTGS